MNIFFLSTLINGMFELYDDRHVVKMILEYTQMLYMVHDLWNQRITKSVNVDGEMRAPYKSGKAHIHHPCTLWAAGCKRHYNTLLSMAFELAEEYSRRYTPTGKAKKVHKCVPHLKSIASHPVPSHVPQTIDASEWFEWIRITIQLKPCSLESIKERIATVNLPPEISFGVTCIAPGTFEKCRVITDAGQLDLVSTYCTYYAHKDETGYGTSNKRKRGETKDDSEEPTLRDIKSRHNGMHWRKTTIVPFGLQPFFKHRSH